MENSKNSEIENDTTSSKKLRIGWQWATEDQWMLHRTTKDAMWRIISNPNGEFSVRDIIKIIQVKEDWIYPRPQDKIPINYTFLLYLWKEYMKIYKQFKPPVLWRLGIKRVGILLLTLYKEDSAYLERFGGAIQYLIDHEEDWKRNPEKTLENLRDWWYREDWRERGKPNLLKLVNKIIDLYKNEMFVRLTINFFVGNIILNKDKWQSPEGCFAPKYWYPRGKGQINYIVHGRRS